MSKKGSKKKHKKDRTIVGNQMWPGMSRAAFEDLEAFLYTLAVEVMGLGEWRFDLSTKPSEDDCSASVFITSNSQHAQVFVCRDWNTKDPEYRQRVLIHELIHCHVDALADTVATARDALGTQAGALWWECCRNQFELAVDNMATAWSKSVNGAPLHHLLHMEHSA